MDWLIFCNIITIVIIHAGNHSYNLSFFSININISTHTVLKKWGGGGHLFSSRKQILVKYCFLEFHVKRL